MKRAHRREQGKADPIPRARVGQRHRRAIASAPRWRPQARSPEAGPQTARQGRDHHGRIERDVGRQPLAYPCGQPEAKQPAQAHGDDRQRVARPRCSARRTQDDVSAGENLGHRRFGFRLGRATPTFVVSARYGVHLHEPSPLPAGPNEFAAVCWFERAHCNVLPSFDSRHPDRFGEQACTLGSRAPARAAQPWGRFPERRTFGADRPSTCSRQGWHAVDRHKGRDRG